MATAHFPSSSAITVVIPGRPMSMNDRKHVMVKAKLTAEIRAAARMEAWAAWGPVAPLLAFPVTVTIADHCRTANLRDTLNAAPTIKAAMDGFTDYGLFPDDSPKFVARIVLEPAVKTGRDELVFTFASAGPSTPPTPKKARA